MITLTIPGAIVPKARPNFRAGQGGYLPPKYRAWKDAAISELRLQHHGQPTITLAHLTISIFGANRGDLDNLTGAILDALVQAEVLKDDSVKCIPSLYLRYFPAKQKDAKAIITIAPVEPDKVPESALTDALWVA